MVIVSVFIKSFWYSLSNEKLSLKTTKLTVFTKASYLTDLFKFDYQPRIISVTI